MNTISAVVIAKNEENMIADCLDSIAFCDEIVVVDSGSEDRTSEIAKRMGVKVFNFKSDDFSKLRNFGLKKAKGDWVLYVDADERISSELAEEIKQIIQVRHSGNPPTGGASRISNDSERFWISQNDEDSGLVGYKVKRKNFYLGSSKKNEWPYIEKLERLFRKDKLKGWKGKLHESPVVEGKIGELDGFLLHYTHRDLTSMLNKTIEWSKIEAELRLAANHPKVTWWRFLRVMLAAFFDSYVRQKGWKVGVVGLTESIYQMFSMFITYARLWEIQQKIKK